MEHHGLGEGAVHLFLVVLEALLYLEVAVVIHGQVGEEEVLLFQ